MNLYQILDIFVILLFSLINIVLWIKPKWYHNIIEYFFRVQSIKSTEWEGVIRSPYFFWFVRVIFSITLIMLLVDEF